MTWHNRTLLLDQTRLHSRPLHVMTQAAGLFYFSSDEQHAGFDAGNRSEDLRGFATQSIESALFLCVWVCVGDVSIVGSWSEQPKSLEWINDCREAKKVRQKNKLKKKSEQTQWGGIDARSFVSITSQLPETLMSGKYLIWFINNGTAAVCG